MCVITNYVEQITVTIKKEGNYEYYKSITLVLCCMIAIAHDHSSLFDKCAVTGCVACEPSANIEDGNTKILAFGYSHSATSLPMNLG